MISDYNHYDHNQTVSIFSGSCEVGAFHIHGFSRKFDLSLEIPIASLSDLAVVSSLLELSIHAGGWFLITPNIVIRIIIGFKTLPSILLPRSKCGM